MLYVDFKEAAQTMAGLTKDGSYQAGSRRTYGIDPSAAWTKLVSARGNELITGRKAALEPDGPGGSWAGEPVAYAVTTFSPGSHVRMKWKLPRWEEPSILQFRVLRAAGGRATIAFHQEGLRDSAARADMLARWESVHDRLNSLFDTDARG